MAVAVVQELVTKFGFLGSTKPLTDYNVSLGGSIKLLGGMFVALEGAAAGFSLWADGVLTGVDALGSLSRQTRVSVAGIQELNFAAEQSQSSSAAMESTIRGLTATIGTAAIQGSADFSRLGISVRDALGHVKTADTVLDEVRQRFRALGLPMAEQEHFASALGIDPSLLQLLNRTDSEMASLRDRARELGTLTGEQVEQAEDYKKSLNSMWFSLNNVKQLVAVGVAPGLGRLADNFAQLLADNREWIVSGIQATIRVIGDLLAAFHRLMPVFAVVAAGFLYMKIEALGFKKVLTLIGKVPIILLITGIALAIDDLIVAFNGGNSVIAKFFKDTFDIDIVKELTGAFETLESVAVNLWDSLTSLFSGLGKILSGNFSEGLSDIWKSVVSFSKAFWLLFDPLIAAIKGLLINILPNWAINLLGISDTGTKTQPTVNPENMGTKTQPTVNPENMGRIPIDAAPTGAARIDNRQVNQDVKIDVRTDDPAAAGRAIDDSLQRQLNNANAQLSTGGR